jgi:ribosome modulation factor
MNIEVNTNSVMIEGQTITRPTSVSPSQWLDFWDDTLFYKRAYENGYNAGLADRKLEWQPWEE